MWTYAEGGADVGGPEALRTDPITFCMPTWEEYHRQLMGRACTNVRAEVETTSSGGTGCHSVHSSTGNVTAHQMKCFVGRVLVAVFLLVGVLCSCAGFLVDTTDSVALKIFTDRLGLIARQRSEFKLRLSGHGVPFRGANMHEFIHRWIFMEGCIDPCRHHASMHASMPASGGLLGLRGLKKLFKILTQLRRPLFLS